MLIDVDSKPKDTILYIAMQLNNILVNNNSIQISDLDTTYKKIDPDQPAFKFHLALSFLFLLKKIEIIKGELRYVSN